MVEVVVNDWILRGDFNVVEHISNVGLEVWVWKGIMC